MNNQRFEIGEEVLCIESTIHLATCPNVVKGKKYTIQHVEYCPSCGIQAVGVGVPCPTTGNEGFCICICNRPFRYTNKHILASRKFVRVEDIDNQLGIAVENENYELAQILHDSKLSN